MRPPGAPFIKCDMVDSTLRMRGQPGRSSVATASTASEYLSSSSEKNRLRPNAAVGRRRSRSDARTESRAASAFRTNWTTDTYLHGHKGGAARVTGPDCGFKQSSQHIGRDVLLTTAVLGHLAHRLGPFCLAGGKLPADTAVQACFPEGNQ